MDRRAAAERFTPAAREAVRAFPIDAGEIDLVAASENITFRVTDRRGGAGYVLRLHRPGYNGLAELNSERVWVRALAEAGLAAPRGVAARDGRAFVEVDAGATGERRQAGMTHWTPGEVLAEVLERTEDAALIDCYLSQLGAIAATIHNQSSGWTPPPGFARRTLDAGGLMGEAPSWGRFWEHPELSPAERRLMLATRERIRAAVERYGTAPATFGLIHADLHTGNMLVDGETLTVIDFDDAAFGWHAYEIAVALSHYQASPRFAQIEAAFLGGYRALRAFPAEAASLIPMFLLVRQLAVIGWLHQRPEVDASARFVALKDATCDGCERFEAPC